jgi:hypothetical protein
MGRHEGRESMIRPFAIEVVLFAAPFVFYAVFLWARNAGVLDPDSWPTRAVVWLTGVALVLVAISLTLLAHFSGAPPHSQYTPAHMENGVLVPGKEE